MNDTLSIGALLPLLLALTLPSASALAQRREPVAPIVKGELGARLDAYMTRLSAFGMSGSLLVAKGGEVILDKGYGLADRKRGVPVEPSTPFMIGSLSKQFTAAAILKLEMEGKLSTSDTLGRFFPGAPADKRGITLHQLLTHTASLGAQGAQQGNLPVNSGLGGHHSRSNVASRAVCAACCHTSRSSTIMLSTGSTRASSLWMLACTSSSRKKV